MLWLISALCGVVVVAVAFVVWSRSETESAVEHFTFDDVQSEDGTSTMASDTSAQTAVQKTPSESWVAPDIMDFDVDIEGENLVLVWDDRAGNEPDLRLAPARNDPATLELSIGESVMARVPAACGLTTDHVALLPLSAAKALGWLDAEFS